MKYEELEQMLKSKNHDDNDAENKGIGLSELEPDEREREVTNAIMLAAMEDARYVADFSAIRDIMSDWGYRVTPYGVSVVVDEINKKSEIPVFLSHGEYAYSLVELAGENIKSMLRPVVYNFNSSKEPDWKIFLKINKREDKVMSKQNNVKEEARKNLILSFLQLFSGKHEVTLGGVSIEVEVRPANEADASDVSEPSTKHTAEKAHETPAEKVSEASRVTSDADNQSKEVKVAKSPAKPKEDADIDNLLRRKIVFKTSKLGSKNALLIKVAELPDELVMLLERDGVLKGFLDSKNAEFILSEKGDVTVKGKYTSKKKNAVLFDASNIAVDYVSVETKEKNHMYKPNVVKKGEHDITISMKDVPEWLKCRVDNGLEVFVHDAEGDIYLSDDLEQFEIEKAGNSYCTVLHYTNQKKVNAKGKLA